MRWASAPSLSRPWDRFFSAFIYDRRLVAFVLAGNLLGLAYGYYYYVPQFELRGIAWLPLMADSPNAVLLFIAAVVGRFWKRRTVLLDAAAFALNLKVGIWTCVLMVVEFDRFLGRPDPLAQWILFVGHAAMAAQGLALVPELRRSRLGPLILIAGLAAMLAMDWVDYGPLDLHPLFHAAGHEGAAGASHRIIGGVATALTLAVWAPLAAMVRARRHSSAARVSEATAT